MKILDLKAREILDSRGEPTVEVDITLENKQVTTASVPSGASTGSKESLELRDKNPNRYHGKGVTKAVENINKTIKNALIGMDLDQVKIDKKLLELDGTKDKSNLGANAILAVSLASLKAAANALNKDLYEYVSSGKVTLPMPFINVINGGAHANNSLDIQEFMIVPVVKTFKEKIRAASEIFHTLKTLLNNDGYSTSVGDEGGFAPNLKSNEEAIEYIIKAIKQSNYIPGKDVYLALDMAATEFYDEKTKTYNIDNKNLNADDMVKYYTNLIGKYPIIGIEDPFYEEDFESFAVLKKLIGHKVMIIADDLYVSKKEYLEKGIKYDSANALILKANQIGTITELVETIMVARKNNYKMIISHRSAETEDTFIADLAIGLNIPYIKTGGVSRGERISKYNRLLRIEEKLRKD